MSQREIHVVMMERKWAVIWAGGKRPRSLHDQKAQAVAAAQELARTEDARVVVFTMDGRRQTGSKPAAAGPGASSAAFRWPM